jgi:hypothetical protein
MGYELHSTLLVVSYKSRPYLHPSIDGAGRFGHAHVLLPCGMAVERSPHRGFAADCRWHNPLRVSSNSPGFNYTLPCKDPNLRCHLSCDLVVMRLEHPQTGETSPAAERSSAAHCSAGDCTYNRPVSSLPRLAPPFVSLSQIDPEPLPLQ